MTKLQFLEEDIKSMEKSIAFHESRIENFGKPNPKGHVYPYSDVNPTHLLPLLRDSLKTMKAEMKLLKRAKSKSKKAA